MLTESIYILFCLPDLDPVGFGTFFMHDPAAESTVSAATHHASSICHRKNQICPTRITFFAALFLFSSAIIK